MGNIRSKIPGTQPEKRATILQNMSLAEVEEYRRTRLSTIASRIKPVEAVTEGLVGFGHIGNNCSLNSILQCLLNTPAFSSFFLSDRFQQDINPLNLPGVEGELILALGNVIRKAKSAKEKELIRVDSLRKLLESATGHVSEGNRRKIVGRMIMKIELMTSSWRS